MKKVNIFEVKAKLSEYLDRAAGGERILICRHNSPVAELRAVEAARVDERPVGPLPGRPAFDVPPSFFEPLAEDELDAWEGVDAEPRGSRPRKASRVAETSAPYGPARARRPARKRR